MKKPQKKPASKEWAQTLDARYANALHFNRMGPAMRTMGTIIPWPARHKLNSDMAAFQGKK